MSLFILTETSAGYALLKAKDKKLLKRDDLAAQSSTAEGLASLLKLKHFQKFENAATALEEVSALVEGKVTPMLANMLESITDEKKISLAVADPKLGNAIHKLPQLSITPISDPSTNDLYRAIRSHLPTLIPGLLPEDLATMSLGLSHSLSRHKLKFSPDKVDTMIIQAIALLDDLDKELNMYAMRVKEWYGWHFPEMAKIINDNLAYAKVITKLGYRSNASNTDFSEILPEEIEAAIKVAAEVSMGSDTTSDDLDNIQSLAEQVIDFTEYRSQLSSYLSARMQAIAPNLTALVGDLVGARLIAHAGSLMNLAKYPASTIQILGAEKALFRALKTKHDTPKYGLIYHASLVGQATGKNKGKIARMVATKAALGLRVDTLADWGVQGEGIGPEPSEEEKMEIGINNRLKIERRLRALEGKPLARGIAIGPGGQQTQPSKFELKEVRKYNPDADGLSNGKVNSAKGKDTSAPKIVGDVNGDEESDEESEVEEANNTPSKTHSATNGTASKAERKAAKAARKAERAARREVKAAKRATKEATKSSKDATTEDGESKKRKRDSDLGSLGYKSEKTKKKKRHSSES